jgi:hypothetical protein
MRFLISFFLCCAALFSGEKVDFLFYVQDAGETNALVPVGESLQEKGYRVAFLAGGTAQSLLMGKEIIQGPDLSSRGQCLDKLFLSDLRSRVEPKVVVTGVAYAAQGQVLDLYRDLPTFAFWDNFNSNGENPYFRTARAVAAKAATLFLPSKAIENDFGGATCVVGHPTLEIWRREIQAFEAGEAVLFIGGYGREYEEAFELFLACAEENPGIEYLVQIHPKSDGAFEKEALNKRPGLSVRILEGLSTIEAVGRAGIVACHQSTVAFQALACGKRAIHVIPKHQAFDSLPIQKGLACKISSPEEFGAALQSKPPSAEEFTQTLGIPGESIETFCQALIEAIPFHCGTK